MRPVHPCAAPCGQLRCAKRLSCRFVMRPVHPCAAPCGQLRCAKRLSCGFVMRQVHPCAAPCGQLRCAKRLSCRFVMRPVHPCAAPWRAASGCENCLSCRFFIGLPSEPIPGAMTLSHWDSVESPLNGVVPILRGIRSLVFPVRRRTSRCYLESLSWPRQRRPSPARAPIFPLQDPCSAGRSGRSG